MTCGRTLRRVLQWRCATGHCGVSSSDDVRLDTATCPPVTMCDWTLRRVLQWLNTATCPPVTTCDCAGASSSSSLPDKSTTSGGVNLLSRTNNDVEKVTRRVGVSRASSFTTADYIPRTTTSSKLVHQTSSLLAKSLKMSSADCVYQRSPSVIAATSLGRCSILRLVCGRLGAKRQLCDSVFYGNSCEIQM